MQHTQLPPQQGSSDNMLTQNTGKKETYFGKQKRISQYFCIELGVKHLPFKTSQAATVDFTVFIFLSDLFYLSIRPLSLPHSESFSSWFTTSLFSCEVPPQAQAVTKAPYQMIHCTTSHTFRFRLEKFICPGQQWIDSHPLNGGVWIVENKGILPISVINAQQRSWIRTIFRVEDEASKGSVDLRICWVSRFSLDKMCRDGFQAVTTFVFQPKGYLTSCKLSCCSRVSIQVSAFPNWTPV